MVLKGGIFKIDNDPGGVAQGIDGVGWYAGEFDPHQILIFLLLPVNRCDNNTGLFILFISGCILGKGVSWLNAERSKAEAAHKKEEQGDPRGILKGFGQVLHGPGLF